MEITKTNKKTLFSRYMSMTRRETLSARLEQAKAEAETKGEVFDREKAKVELNPSNEEVRFSALLNIAKQIEEEKPACLSFLNEPGYPRLKWIEDTLSVWEDKYLSSALKSDKDASHYSPVQALIYIKKAREKAAESRKSQKSDADIAAEKAARKARKAAQRALQKAAHDAKEPERQAAREARKAKAAVKGNNGGGKSKGKKKK